MGKSGFWRERGRGSLEVRTIALTGLALGVVLGAAGLLSWYGGHPRGAPQLTQEEREFIRVHDGSVRAATDPNFPPLDFEDAEGRPRGVAEELLRLVEQRSGLHFKRVRFATWKAIMDAVEAREVDLLKCATRTPERDSYLDFSPSFVNLPSVFITRHEELTSASPKALAGRSLAVSEGYAAQQFLGRHFPDSRLLPVRDDFEALLRASTGEAELAASDLATATHLIQKHRISNLRVLGETGFIYKFAFASRSDWPLLNSILTKTMDSITPEERERILEKGIHLEFDRSPWYTRRFWLETLLVVGALLTLLLLTRVWNYSLLLLVRKRTAQLREHEAALEQTVSERTRELRDANQELQVALDSIKTLRGILPICASCKRIRDDGGYWEQVESYVGKHSEADFSHGICPDCAKKLYPDLLDPEEGR